MDKDSTKGFQVTHNKTAYLGLMDIYQTGKYWSKIFSIRTFVKKKIQ